jgi:hypothetical protein
MRGKDKKERSYKPTTWNKYKKRRKKCRLKQVK